MSEPLRGEIWLMDLNPTVANLFVSRHLSYHAALSSH